MNRECADYYMVDKNGNKAIDSITNLPRLLRYARGEGVFDLAYDEAAQTITATVRVRILPKDMIALDPTTGTTAQQMQPKLDANGQPVSVPFDHNLHATAQDIDKAGHRKVDRAKVGVVLEDIADRISATLNQDLYKLTVDGCSQGNACGCQIQVKFKVELQYHDRQYSEKPHHTVEMYPRALRANAASWGEVNGVDNGGVWIPYAKDHVVTHEVGHLFSWPDEYYKLGGACHRQYIVNQEIDLTTEPPLKGSDTWQLEATANLMGGGVYRPTTGTPIHYVHRIRDWFGKRTRTHAKAKWKVIR